jgi:hypothetical protein
MPKSKTTISIALGLSLILLSGCASDSPSDTASATPSESQSETSEAVEVDEEMSDVEVTLPESFVEGTTDAEIAAYAEKEGYTSFTINSDRSVTYLIPKKDYEEDLVQKREFLDTAMQEIVDGLPGVIKSVTFNDEITEFEVVVDREAYEASEDAQWLEFSLNYYSKSFQLFSLIPENEQRGRVDLIDEATGKVFQSSPWPVQE